MPTLSAWYDFLIASGVNADWASIGTVILATLCVITIFRCFLRMVGVK